MFFLYRSFMSSQALGGHQTAHRKEIEEMQKEHKAMFESQKLDSEATMVTMDFLGRWEEEGGRHCEGKVHNLGFDHIRDESCGDPNLGLSLKL